jgi:hypothetical protein
VRVLDVFVTHYNEHGPDLALSLVPLKPQRASVALSLPAGSKSQATVIVNRRIF